MADHAAECAELLRRLGIERARVLAHSCGCVVALQLALDHPELVGALPGFGQDGTEPVRQA
ncbi:alpha/beta fold hydrolase [Frankia sp. QA3]|uniref:alpha/beta fold hydrolase n=1 Tax=Frankia sp. QA3 TaxID=710111 RepID=UPI001E61546D|nr:alpha/beta hydrolase [Frankia sp. QA3]